VTDALAAARAAKEHVAAALAGHPRVNGVGLARDDAGAPVVKVLLSAPADDLPAEQDGVRVVSEVVGRIEKRTRS
jgi:hypothetical protein